MQGYWFWRMDHDLVLHRVACVHIKEMDPAERKKQTVGKTESSVCVCGEGKGRMGGEGAAWKKAVGVQARAAPSNQEGS